MTRREIYKGYVLHEMPVTGRCEVSQEDVVMFMANSWDEAISRVDVLTTTTREKDHHQP